MKKAKTYIPILLIGVVILAVFTVGIITSQYNQNNVKTDVSIDKAEPAFVLGITTDEKLHVVDLEAGSSAERNGIKIGDVIISIENAKISTPQEAMKNYWTAQAKAKVGDVNVINKNGNHLIKIITIVVERNSNQILFQLTPDSQKTHPGPNKDYPSPTAVPQAYAYF